MIDEASGVRLPVSDTNEVTARIICVADLFTHRVGDCGDPALRIAGEDDLGTAGTNNPGGSERQAISIRIDQRGELAVLRTDFVANAFLGGERVVGH